MKEPNTNAYVVLPVDEYNKLYDNQVQNFFELEGGGKPQTWDQTVTLKCKETKVWNVMAKRIDKELQDKLWFEHFVPTDVRDGSYCAINIGKVSKLPKEEETEDAED